MEEEGGQPRLPDGSGGDGPGGQPLTGGPAELSPHQMDEPGAFGRLQHGLRLGCIAGQRLLAQDVLARGQRLQAEPDVGSRWGGDGDGGHPGQGQRLVHRGQGVRNGETPGPLRRPPGITTDQPEDVEAGRPQGRDMGQAAEARPHHHDADGRQPPVASAALCVHGELF
jgi:hypothetical protein